MNGLTWGVKLERLGRHEEVIAAFDSAIAMAPGRAFPWYLRGNALYELEHFDRAVTAYKKALELDPYCADAWNNLGLSAFRMYHYDEAIDAPLLWQSIRNTENPSSIKAGHFLLLDGTLNPLIPTVKFSVLIQGMHKSGMTRVMPRHVLSCMMTR